MSATANCRLSERTRPLHVGHVGAQRGGRCCARTPNPAQDRNTSYNFNEESVRALSKKLQVDLIVRAHEVRRGAHSRC